MEHRLARVSPAAREAYLRSLVTAGAQGLVLELVQWQRCRMSVVTARLAVPLVASSTGGSGSPISPRRPTSASSGAAPARRRGLGFGWMDLVEDG